MVRIKKKYLSQVLLVFALFIGSDMCIHAQSHYTSRVYVGGHAGLNLSRVEFTPSVTQTFNPGMNAGLNFRYIEEKHFGFIVELNWEQRGWKEDFEELPYNYSRTVNFIQIPFLAHVYFGNRAKFFVNAGPSVSFNVGESSSSNFNIDEIAQNSDFNNRITAQMFERADKKVDYGIQGSIGGEFSINRFHSIYLDARFYFGLANLVKSGRADPIRGANPMTISISAGYWFRVK